MSPSFSKLVRLLLVLFVFRAACACAATHHLPPLLPALASQPPEPNADAILADAKSQASAEHKHILAVFSASWCGPCHLFERFLDDPTTGPIINQAFVVARFDIGERPNDPHHADTPGAEKLTASLGGGEAGYPFIIMLDAAGHPIVDSIRPGQRTASDGNIGYPALPVEIDWFMHMLQQAAPSLSPQQTAALRDWLQQHSHS